jgi:hypothetical protein
MRGIRLSVLANSAARPVFAKDRSASACSTEIRMGLLGLWIGIQEPLGKNPNQRACLDVAARQPLTGAQDTHARSA